MFKGNKAKAKPKKKVWSEENEDDLADDGISTPIIWVGISFLGGFFFLGADWIVLALICFWCSQLIFRPSKVIKNRS